MVIVDNAAYSFAFQVFIFAIQFINQYFFIITKFYFQIDNGIPIISFYNDKNDRELLDLIEYLKFLNNYEDLT